jgi:phosphatidate cytidylyltransferase
MKELATRAISGLLYITLLIGSMYWQQGLLGVIFVLGIITLAEFVKLIKLKSPFPYLIFSFLYFGLWYWCMMYKPSKGSNEAIQILLVITIFVNLFLIKDLFTKKRTPLFMSKRYITSTFYISSGFIFMFLIANYQNTFTPILLLGSFIIVWVNDSFAYFIGKNFGKQKLFPSVSPKKTFEGFLGGLFFACVSSYFIATYSKVYTDEYPITITFTDWLILAITISVFGTLGDLIESKFKRQASVKDSGVIMPGHGGLLDRLDSIIFATPFIYLFLRLLKYVS